MNTQPAPDTAKDQFIRRRVLIGTVSNFVGQSLAFVVAFLLTPYILKHLGAASYGLWVLLGSVVAYGSLLDFGMWGTVIKYVAQYDAQGEYAASRTLLSTVLYAYLAIAVLISLAGFLLAPWLPSLFHLPADQLPVARRLIMVLSLTTGFAIPCFLPLAVLRGLQRYDLVNAIDIVTTLATAAASVFVLWQGFGVIGLALANLGGIFVGLALGQLALQRVAPAHRIRWRGAQWQVMPLIFGFSWPLFMRDMAGRLQTRTDEITIGVFMPVSAVGAYSIARRLAEATQTLTRQFMKTLLPLASQLHAEEDRQRLRGLYKTGTRLTIAIGVALSASIILFAAPILTLWVGADYATHANVVALLTLAGLFASVQWPAIAVLQAMSRHRILAVSALGNGVANLLLSLLLVRSYGLAGVALGTLIPTVIEYCGVVLPYSMRALALRPGEMLREVFVPALLPVLPMLVMLYALDAVAAPQNFVTLAALVATGLGVYALVFISLAANQRERQWFMGLVRHGLRTVTAARQ